MKYSFTFVCGLLFNCMHHAFSREQPHLTSNPASGHLQKGLKSQNVPLYVHDVGLQWRGFRTPGSTAFIVSTLNLGSIYALFPWLSCGSFLFQPQSALIRNALPECTPALVASTHRFTHYCYVVELILFWTCPCFCNDKQVLNIN